MRHCVCKTRQPKERGSRADAEARPGTILSSVLPALPRTGRGLTRIYSQQKIISGKETAMKANCFLSVLLFVLTPVLPALGQATKPAASARKQQSQAAQNPAPSQQQNQQMMQLQHQDIDAMKADLAKIKSSLAQMKANLLTIRERNDMDRWRNNIDMWDAMVDHMDHMLQHMESMQPGASTPAPAQPEKKPE